MITKLVILGLNVSGWVLDHTPPCVLDILFGPLEEFDYTRIELDGPPAP